MRSVPFVGIGTPISQVSVVPPRPRNQSGNTRLRAAGEVGSPISDDGRESLVPCPLCALGAFFLGMLSIRHFVIRNFVIWNSVIRNSVIRKIGIRNSIPAPSDQTVQLKAFQRHFILDLNQLFPCFFNSRVE
jgi:hypothetical protein